MKVVYLTMSLNRLDTSHVISALLGCKAFPLDTSGIPSNTSHLVTKFCLFLYLVHAYLSHSVPSSYPVFLSCLQPPRLSHPASATWLPILGHFRHRLRRPPQAPI